MMVGKNPGHFLIQVRGLDRARSIGDLSRQGSETIAPAPRKEKKMTGIFLPLLFVPNKFRQTACQQS